MTGPEGLGVTVACAVAFAYLVLRYVAHRTIDYWRTRMDRRQRELEWDRQYGKGPHGD